MKSAQCNHINGTCIDGCDQGFEGLNCTKGKFLEALLQRKNILFIMRLLLHNNVDLFPNIFTLCVYSECDDGNFGENCIDKCNATCRSCNKTTGICDNGCQPGWRGLNCQDGILCYRC